MGFADQLLQAFLQAHPEAASGKYSLEELNEKLAAFAQQINQQAKPDFDGLSPQQMHGLLYDPLSPQAIVQLKSSYPDEVLDRVPFFRLMEMLWDELLTQGKIKLTPKGNFQLAFCRRLYDQHLIVQDDIESGITLKISEDNIDFIRALKACLMISGWAKKRNNVLTLTKKGSDALRKDRTSRFAHLVHLYTSQFNWAYFDYLEDEQAGQFGWAFTLFLLHRYGDQWRKTGFYSDKFRQAFPMLPEKVPSSVYANVGIEFGNVYRWRFFDRFAHWFGLVERQKKQEPKVYPPVLLVKRTELFSQLIVVR